MGTLSLLFFTRFDTLKKYSGFIEENTLFLTDISNLRFNINTISNDSRGFMITGNERFIKSIENEKQQIAKLLESLKLRSADDMRQKDLVRDLNSLVNRCINLNEWNIKRVRNNDTFGLSKSMEHANLVMEQFYKQADNLSRARLEEGEEYKNIKARYEGITPSYFQYVLWFSGIITLISFYYLHREMKIRVKYQLELEDKLQEINRSAAEMEQFSFVASHDLQEPLRKIRTFTDRLLFTHGPEFREEIKEIFAKLNTSSIKMQEMIQDMIDFTNLVHTRDTVRYVDLNFLLNNVKKEFSQFEHNATLLVEPLPVIKGYPDQLQLLFRSLIDNSLKFSENPNNIRIEILYKRVKSPEVDGNSEEFHEVSIHDNGIGFNNEFAKKIFVIFQRLHSPNSEFQGKGIGLALAKRIMTNHNGYIQAKGITGKGASFILRFPN